jgi:hypothetical protein
MPFYDDYKTSTVTSEYRLVCLRPTAMSDVKKFVRMRAVHSPGKNERRWAASGSNLTFSEWLMKERTKR